MKVSSNASRMRRSVSRIRPLELAHRGLEVLALGLELLDVGDRFLVLALGERVDRPELLAAAAQPLDAALEVGACAFVERLVRRLGLEPELGGEAGELAACVGRPVARLLGPDLAARDLLAALLQPRLDLRLLCRARPQLGRQPLSGLAVGAQLGLERGEPLADGLGGGGQRRGEPLRGGTQRLVPSEPLALGGDPPLAIGTLALGALDQPPLARERRLDLRPPLTRRTLVGRGAALLDQPAGVPLGLGRLVARTSRRAGRLIGLVPRRVRGLHRARCLLDLRRRRLLGLRCTLHLGEQRIAPVALGEHPILTARGHLTKLADDGRPGAPVTRDRDAPEPFGERRQVVHDPDAGEQRRGEPPVALVAHVGGERLGAARGRRRIGGGRRRTGRHDQGGAAVAAGAVEEG